MTLRTLPAARARAVRWDLLPHVSRPAARVQRLVAAHLAGTAPRSWAAVPAALAAAFGGVAPRVAVGVPYAFPLAELATRQSAAPWAAARVRRPDGRGLAVIVDGVFLARLFARLLGAPAELPAPREVTAAEQGVLAGLCALALEAAAVPGLVVDGATGDQAGLRALLPDPWVIGVDVRVEAGGLGGIVRVLAPESLLAAEPPGPLSGAAALAPGDGRRWLERIVVRAAVVLARVSLVPAELAALARGDVIVLPEGTTRGRAWLCAGRGGFALHHDDTRLTVTDAWQQGAPMADPNDALARDLSVPVSCRLAQLELSLRELLELGPGAIIGLARPLGAPVELVAAERVIARGELVDVDGELGVRVTEIVS